MSIEETCDRCLNSFHYNHPKPYINHNNSTSLPFAYHPYSPSLNSNSSTMISQRELEPKCLNPYLTRITPSNLNNINHPETSSITSNYINDLTASFAKEKEELQAKLLSLSKAFESTKSSLNDKVTTLQNSLQEQEGHSRLNIQTLNTQFSFEMKKIKAERDSQIQLLLDKNKELSSCNEDLMQKIDQYITVINETKMNLSSCINSSECEMEHLRNELKRQREFYENKVQYITQSNEDEKKKLVKSYEDTSEQLKLSYEEAKGKFHKLIEARTTDVRSAIDTHQADHDKLIKVNSEYKRQIDQLTEEKIELMRNSQEQRFDIERLTKANEKLEEEKTSALNDKIAYEAKADDLVRQNDSLMLYNNKLSRLTHGKIKK